MAPQGTQDHPGGHAPEPITVDEMAALIGITHDTVYAMIHGDQNPGVGVTRFPSDPHDYYRSDAMDRTVFELSGRQTKGCEGATRARSTLPSHMQVWAESWRLKS
jgi:hypothetical protein